MDNQFNYDPNTNQAVISLIIQEDGNWIGETQRFGKLVKVREAKPEDALAKLLTHNGNI